MSKTNRQLIRYRKRLMHLDARLISLLDQRITIAVEIGKIKRIEKIKIRQSVFLNSASKKRKAAVAGTKLNPVFMKNLFEAIHKESIKIQQQVKREK